MAMDGPSGRAWWTAAAGWATILLSAGAALLPAVDHVSGTRILGAMLVAAGLAELLAGTSRHVARIPAMAAGALTMGAGAVFLVGAALEFFPTMYLVTGWLVLRSLALVVASFRAGKLSVRNWTLISAATDFLLALVLLAGLSIATMVIMLFGPTPEFIATFAWVIAASFIATGTMLLEVANCEREEDC